MPVTDPRWGFVQNQVQSVYPEPTATKRKLVGDHSVDSLEQDQLFSTENTVAKRQCGWDEANLETTDLHSHPLDPSTGAYYQGQTLVSSGAGNHLYMETISQQQTYNMETAQQNLSMIDPTMPIEVVSPQLTDKGSAPPRSMNINEDDCYDDRNDYMNAYGSMESEGAVDRNQYGLTSTRNLHERTCFGEEQSPNSDQKRCYCRPGWGSMMQSNYFNSDIY